MVGNSDWNAYAKEHLEQQFPELADEGYTMTSPDTIDYNCVAWAVEIEEEWWWPDAMGQEYWPEGVLREETLSAFVAAFETVGYEICDSSSREAGFLKIAIYGDAYQTPKHVARQLANGEWTSKIGQYEDIRHKTLKALTGHLCLGRHSLAPYDDAGSYRSRED
ncbi:hypothetical protein [cf. Phormidesmis sp. LEGE 11477]|uniref:DUF7689 domain-containing protein n=1 Tax=cf. Phormidesmis sp. LEGE 11477 TaxID=1828680 RepID=UPI001882BB34|nr:hypothetical protein [cf. Phormidesmis sp. LEGE 11477]MBE9061931.1 hypothetical protein [cf. Phormidesmis sp. LEGE 11477]